jgi:ferredoxin-fold anticodon binding domain-containing protein
MNSYTIQADQRCPLIENIGFYNYFILNDIKVIDAYDGPQTSEASTSLTFRFLEIPICDGQQRQYRKANQGCDDFRS